MIGIRASTYVFRRGVFYGVAATDLLLRLFMATTGWNWVTFSDGVSGSAPELTAQTAAAVPFFGAAILLSAAAYGVAQVAVKVPAYLRLVSATLLVGSLIIFAIGPWVSLIGAAMAYLILTSGRIDGANDAQK